MYQVSTPQIFMSDAFQSRVIEIISRYSQLAGIREKRLLREDELETIQRTFASSDEAFLEGVATNFIQVHPVDQMNTVQTLSRCISEFNVFKRQREDHFRYLYQPIELLNKMLADKADINPTDIDHPYRQMLIAIRTAVIERIQNCFPGFPLPSDIAELSAQHPIMSSERWVYPVGSGASAPSDTSLDDSSVASDVNESSLMRAVFSPEFIREQEGVFRSHLQAVYGRDSSRLLLGNEAQMVIEKMRAVTTISVIAMARFNVMIQSINEAIGSHQYLESEVNALRQLRQSLREQRDKLTWKERPVASLTRYLEESIQKHRGWLGLDHFGKVLRNVQKNINEYLEREESRLLRSIQNETNRIKKELACLRFQQCWCEIFSCAAHTGTMALGCVIDFIPCSWPWTCFVTTKKEDRCCPPCGDTDYSEGCCYGCYHGVRKGSDDCCCIPVSHNWNLPWLRALRERNSSLSERHGQLEKRKQECEGYAEGAPRPVSMDRARI